MLIAGSPDDTTTVAAGVSAAAAAAGQQSATTDDYMWLRGVQQTDEDGMVEFETIVPGWYSGRTAHIHVKVRLLTITPTHDTCTCLHHVSRLLASAVASCRV